MVIMILNFTDKKLIEVAAIETTQEFAKRFIILFLPMAGFISDLLRNKYEYDETKVRWYKPPYLPSRISLSKLNFSFNIIIDPQIVRLLGLFYRSCIADRVLVFTESDSIYNFL